MNKTTHWVLMQAREKNKTEGDRGCPAVAAIDGRARKSLSKKATFE